MAQYSFASVRQGYTDLWNQMKVIKVDQARAQARRICSPSAKMRYQKVEATTGVPWFVVGCLHMRESNADFNTWLHNGDPMRRNGKPVQTVHVPANRPPDPNVSWEQGAYDALVTIEHLDQIKDWGPEHVAYAAEKFNGFGYRNPNRNIPSPYLWGGTSVQQRGKYVSDGKYDPNVMDTQIGAMAVLREIMELDVTAKFPPPQTQKEVITAAVDVATLPPPASPRADDTVSDVKPVIKGKTVWGGFVTWLGGILATIAGMFQYIATPWGFAAFALIVFVLCVGLYLVIKGRLDVQKVITHLSQDDTETNPDD